MTLTLPKIVIFGGGFAGQMTALALSQLLPKDVDITFLQTQNIRRTDLFYGTVTSPSTYDFLLSMGITEPELLLGTDTSFSLGTRFENWGPQDRSWTQAFHQPLPIYEGVQLRHYVNKHYKGSKIWSLDPYIMSVEAANRGVFAHPPEGKKNPLATVEYGYHFEPQQWAEFFAGKLVNNRVNCTSGTIAKQDRDGETLKALVMDHGQRIEGDFFIDCSGQTDNENWPGSRIVCAAVSYAPQENLNGVVRTAKETQYGWHAAAPLRGHLHNISVFDRKDEALLNAVDNSAVTSIRIGRDDTPWQGNTLKLGHSAGALEPLTPAPVMTLQRDIERLIELIPTSVKMTIEAREYNRRFVQDFDHAVMFHRALFEDASDIRSSYYNAVTSAPISPALEAKITQFEARGVCVQYDLEPFEDRDWTMLHLGMGRIPTRSDPLTDRASKAQITQMLENISRANKQMGAKMPPHQVYMTGLLKFLKEKHD